MKSQWKGFQKARQRNPELFLLYSKGDQLPTVHSMPKLKQGSLYSRLSWGVEACDQKAKGAKWHSQEQGWLMHYSWWLVTLSPSELCHWWRETCISLLRSSFLPLTPHHMCTCTVHTCKVTCIWHACTTPIPHPLSQWTCFQLTSDELSLALLQVLKKVVALSGLRHSDVCDWLIQTSVDSMD
jgi:hypothetical protein